MALRGNLNGRCNFARDPERLRGKVCNEMNDFADNFAWENELLPEFLTL